MADDDDAIEVAKPGAIGSEVGVQPHDALRIEAHEHYAQYRSRGWSINRAAKAAGVQPSTARARWEPPQTGITFRGSEYRDHGVGGAIQRRIEYLRAAARAPMPSLSQLRHQQLRLVAEAMAAGKYEVARRQLDTLAQEATKQLEEDGFSEDVLEVDGEDVDDILENPDG